MKNAFGEIEIWEGTQGLLVDANTGEVLYEANMPPQWEEDISAYDISIDTKEGAIALRKKMGRGMPYTHIRDWISHLVIEDCLSGNALRLFMYLGDHVEWNSLSYIHLKEAEDALKMSKHAVSRAIKELGEKGFIREMYKNTFGVGSRVYRLSPTYFWKGEYAIRGKWWMEDVRDLARGGGNSIK